MEVFAPALVLSVLTLTLGATFILRGPLGKALADRLAHRASRDDGEVERLRADVDDLRGLVGELQERLEFAERLLLQQREAGRLPGGN
jgi:hypothetical protein